MVTRTIDAETSSPLSRATEVSALCQQAPQAAAKSCSGLLPSLTPFVFGRRVRRSSTLSSLTTWPSRPPVAVTVVTYFGVILIIGAPDRLATTWPKPGREVAATACPLL